MAESVPHHTLSIERRNTSEAPEDVAVESVPSSFLLIRKYGSHVRKFVVEQLAASVEIVYRSHCCLTLEEQRIGMSCD